MSIKKKCGNIIGFLTRRYGGCMPVTGIDASELFRPGETGDISIARNLAASFITILSGPASPGFDEASRYLDGMKGTPWDPASRFLSDGVDLVTSEIESRYRDDERFHCHFDALHDTIARSGGPQCTSGIVDLIWRAFFPEGVIDGDRSASIDYLKEKRTIRITELNDKPIHAPEREVLFTANALLTIPSSPADCGGLDPEVREAAEAAAGEEQLYWYDHPIPVGTPAERNELAYGLGNLSGALRFEESAGTKDPARNIDCVVSVSVTHRGLRGITRTWLKSMLAGEEATRGINLHVFTEDDTNRMLDEILLPAVQHYAGGFYGELLRKVFGVDGEYGRHYNFLKAIARFWNVFVSPEIRATFKIDLDQAFPQEELVCETGVSAFGHLCTPLWGASGHDSDGIRVHLGMIAGTLVNRKDIGASLFTPDVSFPGRDPEGDETIFWSTVPQALSTEAEMMTRYGAGWDHDGATSCIQRVHVTGGTTGITVEALTRYRPFTPTCIGRAEDQAYLLSVLYKPDGGGQLRYAHVPGLVMRHDADLFTDAADATRTGKTLGDYVRTMLFSDYARALPWPFERTKDAVDPFTGCFITPLPITIVYLRFALRAASLFAADDPAALLFFTDGVKRLSGMMDYHKRGENPMEKIYECERRGWDLYYDVLSAVEKGLSESDHFALDLAEKAKVFVDSVRIGI